MLALDFLRSPGPSRPVYAVLGDDAYLRREALSAVVHGAIGAEGDDFSVSRYPGDSASLADVLDDVRTLPFLAKCRVAIVENADPFVTAHRKELEAYAEKPAKSGVLVLMVKTWPGNTKLAKIVEKMGLAIDCSAPKERELPAWLGSLAKILHDKKMDAEASALLLDLVGPEVGLLVSEVEKLATYVGTRDRISSDDVAKMVGSGRVQEIWGILDAAALGRGAEAVRSLDALIASGEAPIALLAAMTFSLRKVYHAGTLRRLRKDGREACREAGIFSGAVEKTLQQHAHLGPGRVDRLPEMLLKADLDLKGFSQLPPRVILENLLVGLAGPRQD